MPLLFFFVPDAIGREAPPGGQVAAAIHSDLFRPAAVAAACGAGVRMRKGRVIAEHDGRRPGGEAGRTAVAGLGAVMAESLDEALSAREGSGWRRFGRRAMGSEGFKMCNGGFGWASECMSSHSMTMLTSFFLHMLDGLIRWSMLTGMCSPCWKDTLLLLNFCWFVCRCKLVR